MLCGVLEYTSEHDIVYCSSFLIKKLQLKSLKKSKTGVVLEVLYNKKNKYAFPELKKVELYCDKPLSENVCKRGILGYSTIQPGNILPVITKQIFDGTEEYKIFIHRTYPKQTCMIINDSFEVVCICPHSKNFVRKESIDEKTIYRKLSERIVDKKKLILRSKKRVKDGNEESFALQEIVGKQLSPGPMISKNFYNKIEEINIPTAKHQKILSQCDNNSEDSVDERTSLDFTHNLTPVYNAKNESPLRITPRLLPTIKRLRSLTPVLKSQRKR